MTNSAGAEDFRLCEAPVAAPQPENWREILPHKPGRLILDIVAFEGHLVRLEREDGLPRIVIRRLADGAEHAIAFDEEAYSLGMSAGYEFDTTTLRFIYSSMTTPAQVFDYDMESRARVLRKTQEVPSGHNPADYVTRRLMAPGARRRDGADLRALREGHAARRHPRRCSSTATAPTASPSRRRSRPRACRWSTAASSSPSPTSAAARTRATAGTRTASCEQEAEHLHRLHRRRRVPRRAGLHQPRPHRRQRRLGRRHADGRGRQHGAGPVPRHHRRRAVRRRAEHHARRDACR